MRRQRLNADQHRNISQAISKFESYQAEASATYLSPACGRAIAYGNLSASRPDARRDPYAAPSTLGSAVNASIRVKIGAAVGWAEAPFAPCPPTEPAAQHIGMVGGVGRP